MIIKNISKKIINIGSSALLPDDEIEISKDVADTPAIQVLLKHAYLEGREEAKTEVTEEAKAVEEPKEEKKESAPKKTTKKKSE